MRSLRARGVTLAAAGSPASDHAGAGHLQEPHADARQVRRVLADLRAAAGRKLVHRRASPGCQRLAATDPTRTASEGSSPTRA